jgi:cell division protein FtsB
MDKELLLEKALAEVERIRQEGENLQNALQELTKENIFLKTEIRILKNSKKTFLEYILDLFKWKK